MEAALAIPSAPTRGNVPLSHSSHYIYILGFLFLFFIFIVEIILRETSIRRNSHTKNACSVRQRGVNDGN